MVPATFSCLGYPCGPSVHTVTRHDEPWLEKSLSSGLVSGFKMRLPHNSNPGVLSFGLPDEIKRENWGTYKRDHQVLQGNRGAFI